MTADYTVQAWKDPDLREALGMLAHPSGEIELGIDDPVGGSTPSIISAISAVTGVTLEICTPAYSCHPAPTCDYSVGHGTCGWFSYGCC